MDTTGKRLRLLYPDIHGLERGKYLFGSVAESGHAAFCIGVYPLTHDREILAVPNTQFDIGPARHRRAPGPGLAPSLLGAGDRDRHRRRNPRRRTGADRPSPRLARSRRGVARPGAGAADQLRARVLPDGARRWCRMAAHLASRPPCLRDRDRRRPDRLRRRDGHHGARLRIQRGDLEQRVRRGRLRGEHPLRRRAQGRRRRLHLPAADPRDRRAPRQAGDLPGQAVERPGRQRHARQLQLPS